MNKFMETNIEKTFDFFMNKLKESGGKEKTIHLVDYSYRWYLGLRGRDIFEEEIDTQDFLNNIWSCYGELSAERLREMLNSECIYIHYNTRYRNLLRGRPHLLSRDASGVWRTHKHMGDFYSYHNEEIEKYLPPNVVITISDDGLYQIVKFVASDDK